MDIYLPIAEVSLDIFVLLGLGAAVGFLSGVFGVGGGFLMTPLLIFIGVPPTVAVASSANQLVGASVSGVLSHWRRGNVDFKMGYVLLVGGVAGSFRGVWIFPLLKRLGQFELTISICYVLLLGTLGRTCSGQPPNCPRPRKPRRGQKASLSNGRSRRTSGAAISSKDERDRSLQHKQPRVTLVRVRSTITFGLISPSRSSSPSRRRATSNSGLSHRPLPFSMCRTTPRPAAQ